MPSRLIIPNGSTDPVRLRHQANMAARKKDIGGRWVPASNTFHDTFTALSYAQRPRPPKEPYHAAFVAVYPKQGSYGWNGYTFSKYPLHLPDPYDGPHTTKDMSTEQQHRPPYKAVGKLGILYFTKNPYFVENPPKEPPESPAKPMPAWLNSLAFRPPGRSKPMKRMKYWGTFHNVEDLGGSYVVRGPNPFRPDFYGKQTRPFNYIPPAGPKKVLITPVTVANMAGQMDIRKADKQDTVYGENARTIPPFPKIDKVKERLAAKGFSLYSKPREIRHDLQKITVAPINKPWYA